MKKNQVMKWLQNKVVLAALLMILVAGTATVGVMALRSGQSGEQDQEEKPGYAFQTEEDRPVHDQQPQMPNKEQLEDIPDLNDVGLLQKPDQEAVEETEAERPVQSGDVDAVLNQSDAENAEKPLEDPLDDEMAETLVSGDDAVVYEPDAEMVIAPGVVLDFQADSTIGWPVFGNVILDYSMDRTIYFPTLKQYKCNPGILIQAEIGQPVAAAVQGKVTVIGSNEELGNYVQMDLGGDYSILYGQLENLTVYVDQIVEPGHILGVVAAPTKYYVVEGPNIYLEMRYQDKTVDPLEYLR